MTVCDLAGSERCKEQSSGERMKEATNINTSLLTLGRCITALRHNQNKYVRHWCCMSCVSEQSSCIFKNLPQTSRSRPPQVVPFRDSKLTRVLQGYFCGRGVSCMVVNLNPCASIYDETLQALKFSAIATQVRKGISFNMPCEAQVYLSVVLVWNPKRDENFLKWFQLVHGPSTKTRVAYILSLLREPAANANESTVMEDEGEDSDVEDGDITMLNTEVAVLSCEQKICTWLCSGIHFLLSRGFWDGAATTDGPLYHPNVSLSRLCCRPLMSWRGRCNVSAKRKRLLRQMWGSRLSLRWWRSSMTCRMASGVCARRKLAPRMFLSYLLV